MSACHQSWLDYFWTYLTRSRRDLLSLQEWLEKNTRLLGAYYCEVCTIPLGQIVGSEGRSEDFDQDFNPTNENNRERWVSVAAARLQSISLPLVELI